MVEFGGAHLDKALSFELLSTGDVKRHEQIDHKVTVWSSAYFPQLPHSLDDSEASAEDSALRFLNAGMSCCGLVHSSAALCTAFNN